MRERERREERYERREREGGTEKTRGIETNLFPSFLSFKTKHKKTGHTLRLLQFPTTLQKGLDKLMSFKSAIGERKGERERETCFFFFMLFLPFGCFQVSEPRETTTTKDGKRNSFSFPHLPPPITPPLPRSRIKPSGGAMATMGPLLGAPADMQDALIGKLDELKSVVDEVNTQFRNPLLTTFVCVCIPEFLSLYETERLVQELAKFEIDCRNVVVNQVISPSEVGSSRLLAARVRMQAGYLAQFDELYEDFHLVRMPLLDEEVRGVEALRAFSRLLVDPAAAEEAGRRGTLLPGADAAAGGDGGEAGDGGSSGPLEAEVSRLRARVAELERELAAAKK